MKRLTRLNCFLIVGFVLLTSSCAGSGMPSCTDSAVTVPALKILQDKLSVPIWAAAEVEYDKTTKCGILEDAYHSCGKNGTACGSADNGRAYKAWQDCTQDQNESNIENRGRDEVKQNAIAKVLSNGIVNIRVVAKDESTKKISCAGTASGTEIQYTAQRTEDGKIYVEAAAQ